MTHSSHAPISVAGLADGCERCAEMAEDPFSTLDQANMRDLINRTLKHRFGYVDGGGRPVQPRSEAEAIAMAKTMTRLEQTGQLFDCSPRLVAHYLRDRWNVPIKIEEAL